MIVLGFGFKVAAVPFHFWAPDVYEGAPANSAALIASSAKVAGFVIFYQVMIIGFAGAEGSGDWRHYTPGWVPVIAVVAALSMVLGNLVAITQTSVRRLLAYSAIAQAGYILLALVSHTEQSFDALLYYAVTYALTVIGAFGVVLLSKSSSAVKSSPTLPGSAAVLLCSPSACWFLCSRLEEFRRWPGSLANSSSLLRRWPLDNIHSVCSGSWLWPLP